MKMRTSIIAAVSVHLVLFSTKTNAQTDADALRYSQTSITGTARYTAMAGAFGALGGDFSSIATNPAGLGIYRSSEFTLSSSLYMNQTTSNFLGTSSTENRYNFNIPNLGFVFNHPTRDQNGWKSWSIGIGLNRINSFQSNTYYQGFNQNNSLLDRFTQDANGIDGRDPNNFDQFNEGLAYNAGLIYYDSANAQYISDLRPGEGVTQKITGTTRGAMNEWNFSFGANYNDILYLGAALGVRTIHYDDESLYQERVTDNDTLQGFDFQQNVVTDGTGVNFKLGAIVRPVDWLRIGGSVHTPTVYSMHDDYSNAMTSYLTGYNFGTQSSPSGHFDYTLTTPLEATASVGFIIAKTGLIGIDYEVVDYSSSRFSASGGNWPNVSDVNDFIRTNYTTAGNLRIGCEYRLQNLAFRLGYANYSSPYSVAAKISGADYSRSSISGGLGIRDKNYFVDLAYIYSLSHEYFQPYTLADQIVPGVINDVATHNVVITFGVKW